ncbi:TetR/AcrR family transcriptional regulator [Pleomorphomonas carboxyditropha]|uniref:TetR family transcriptional regulator n=1 Tax=Pleomorphomonas carboxyditropha TaxID=2023338 RepID=A0A2G9WRU1_9HYPH|nr:TetR/AcrR family transcriptional regulator [Pleomorphomonas carboxyditropha]PIO97365.1 TetR family transcriptional regulator [Pleomorphomonas carboxyditropha]
MTTRGRPDDAGEGVRQRKRRETLQRIRDRGICLFIEKGYAATTLDDIAAAAGISRRTFFYYFKSKDEILLSLQNDVGDMLVDALGRVPQDRRPLDAIRDAAVDVCALIPADDMIAIDRLMRESDAVQARKQASYVEQEKALFAALRERWPDPSRETGLRLVAMLAIGAMRLATDAFNRQGGKRPMPELLNEAFDALEAEI